MYLTGILLQNLGPIKQLTIEPRFSASGNPIPLIFVGPNGAGKSLALSVIVDAITEARRQAFRQLPEVEGTDYL